MPIIIKIFKKKQASQTILGYVENHKDKNGTLTMGGVVFMITTLVLSFFFLDFNNVWFVVLLVSVFYGVLGLMDDYLKIKFKQNMGLRAYQKIIGQVGISLIFAIFVYFSTSGGQVFLPFTNKMIDIGFWIVPLIVLVMVAITNSVNLTDGLDGLAGNVTNIYLI
ncbi:MAG: phospho-N-acetylmuramoyl-pentapeptide-transferase, partial [Clostridia bacterium]|nr:phospho-N-acetylmuramoyl-pentapeptide-transferase [Clostridia bacterium]